jgi:hypothetical protein
MPWYVCSHGDTDVFIGRLEYLAQPPLVHLYSFSKEDDPARDVIEVR